MRNLPKNLAEAQVANTEMLKVVRLDVSSNAVADRQIMSAIIHECSLGFVENKFLYEVLQSVANEARERGLLHNIRGPELYSRALGNTSRMRPRPGWGWEQIKGILSRRLFEGRFLLLGLIRRFSPDLRRERSSTTRRSRPPALGM